MKRAISFDIASKSLAWSVVDYNPSWMSDTLAAKSLEEVHSIIASAIDVKDWGVVDLMPGVALKDVDNVQRSRSLRRVLGGIDTWRCDGCVVLLEYQMSANYNANAVYNQIMYHFNHEQVETISPTLKNKVKLGKGLAHQDFVGKYAASYTANKNHTKANLLHFAKVFGREMPAGIAAKNKDDLADSFMQAMWWHLHGHAR